MPPPNRGEERAPRPTMADVGRLAGVSPTAVSFVINGRVGEVSDGTRDRVLDAVRALGYRPNRAARGLRTRRSHTIGVVTAALHELPCGGRTVSGAAAAAAEFGSRLMLATVARSGPRAAVEDLLDRQVDALLLTVADAAPLCEQVPAVLVNCPPGATKVPTVLAAERQGARDATALLLRHGHRRIAVLDGPPGGWRTRERVAGHLAALGAAGVPHDGPLVLSTSAGADAGFAGTRYLLRRRPAPTALLCGTDRIAVGACLAVAEAGLRVPNDMSVICYEDGTDLAPQLRPALSTVHVPYEALGRRAVERLLCTTRDRAEIRTHLPCPVVSRASVCRPRADDPGSA